MSAFRQGSLLWPNSVSPPSSQLCSRSLVGITSLRFIEIARNPRPTPREAPESLGASRGYLGDNSLRESGVGPARPRQDRRTCASAAPATCRQIGLATAPASRCEVHGCYRLHRGNEATGHLRCAG